MALLSYNLNLVKNKRFFNQPDFKDNLLLSLFPQQGSATMEKICHAFRFEHTLSQ